MKILNTYRAKRPSGSSADDSLTNPARPTGLRRISWRRALGEIALPALRLHRYRAAHNRLLLDALCERDCGPGREGI